MKYLLTGGGTGGHVYPALAIADEIRRGQPDASFLYVGLRDKLEAWAVPARGYPICFVTAKPYPRHRSLGRLVGFVVHLALGLLKALFLLLRFRPNIIICTGGYVSAPIMFGHSLLAKVGLSKAKVFVYEPNAFPGKLNKLVGRLADRVGVAFEQASHEFKSIIKRVAVVGHPVRRELLEVSSAQARQRLGIGADKQVVMAFGGSGGSRAINEAIVEALVHLKERPNLVVVHITGRYSGPDYRAVDDTVGHLVALGLPTEQCEYYRRFDYMENIGDAYAVADVVLCRGGAATLTEVCSCGLPALIVPLPTAAEDHQAINGRELERRGAARVLYQQARWQEGQIVSHIDPETLVEQVVALLEQPQKRQQMAAAARSVPRPNSLELILKEINALSSGDRPPALNLELPLPAEGLPDDPNAFLHYIQKACKEAGGLERVPADQVAYWRYRADKFLTSTQWYEIPLGRRNVGIKLIGYLRYEKHLPLLLSLLSDPTRVRGLRRWLGGDFHHGGFLRRNCIEYGLVRLGSADLQVEKALLRALAEDPYFEVRAAAARALGELFPPGSSREDALVEALDDPATAVTIQALRALGELAGRGEIMNHFHRFYHHPDWRCRQALVQALGQLLDRGIVEPDQVAGDFDHILATSSHFQPLFPLGQDLRALSDRLNALAKGEARQQAGKT